LYGKLAAMRVAKLRVYLDAAFVQGGKVMTVNAGPLLGPAGMLTPRSWVTLAGSGNSDVFVEDPRRPRTIFTESLVAGLRGVADTTGNGNRDGVVSADELHGFLRDQFAAASVRIGRQPSPVLFGSRKEPLRAY
jgi:hypothetical protein